VNGTHVRLIITGFFLVLAALVVAGQFGGRHNTRHAVPPTGTVVREDWNGTPQTGSVYQRIPQMQTNDLASILAMIGDCGPDGTYRAQILNDRGAQLSVQVSRAVYRACLPSALTPTRYPVCAQAAGEMAA
jgi:hypothetical protein